jgi:uncharacterized membrane protein YgaE (UPF0421/DUF939 family)
MGIFGNTDFINQLVFCQYLDGVYKMEFPIQVLRPFLGLRIIKTGLAVFLVLILFGYFGPHYATFAAVAAILAIQPSVLKAKQVFVQQLLSNLLGGTVAVLLGLWLGPSPLAMALGVIIVLGLCSRFGLNEAANLAVVVVIFVMDRPDQDFVLYTFMRVASITGGMLIGYLINRFVAPPRLVDRLRGLLLTSLEETNRFAKHVLSSLPAPDRYEKQAIKAEVQSITKHLDTARYLLDLALEANPGDRQMLPASKVRASLFVFVERLMEIHKITLRLGSLREGLEAKYVTTAIHAVMNCLDRCVKAALNGGTVSADLHIECSGLLEELHEHVLEQVADPHSRERGLLLHQVYTSIRHMQSRVESLKLLISRGTPSVNEKVEV